MTLRNVLHTRAPVLAVAAAAAGAVLVTGAAQAASTLSGPSTLHVQQKVAYRAGGLAPEGKYSLRIRRRVVHDGRAYRCSAYLAAPRRASGTERFLGSVPDTLQCTPARGAGAAWRPPTLKGVYQAVVCVAATRAYLCKPGYSVAAKRVRIR